MSHLTYGANRYHELNRENDYRPYLLGEETPPAGYRFGRFGGGRIRASARSPIRIIVRALKFMHEGLVASRIRRAERELQLRPHGAHNLATRRGIGSY